jgi:nucleoside-diphosphate-sugar epimerase
MIVAVTGATGFIGQRLAQRFSDANWIVRRVVRRDFQTDAGLEHRFDGADVVVHAAGATRAPSVRLLDDANVRLTGRVIEAARRTGVGRVVFISSQAAAGPARSRNTPVVETDSPAPIEAYGRTKLDAERLLHSASGLSFVIVRPAAVYGPGDRDFLALFRLARLGIAVHPGNRDQWISILHVDDLASGVIRASTNARAVGRTYFMSNPNPVQWGQLARACGECTQRSLRVDVQLPRSLVRAGAVLGDLAAQVTGRASLLTTRKLELAAPNYWICSSQLAERELEFATAITLGDGLRATYDWYVANGWT